MNPHPPDDARLESWLRQQASTAPLPDDGFSTRVLAALPRRREPFPWRRVLVCIAGALLGALATRLDVGEWPTLASVFDPVNGAVRTAIAFASDPWVAAAVAVSVMVAASALAVSFALRDEESTETWF